MSSFNAHTTADELRAPELASDAFYARDVSRKGAICWTAAALV
jgi:hypothetical protein